MLEFNRKLTPREKLFLILAGVVVGMSFWKTITLSILPYSSEFMGLATEDYIASAGMITGIVLALLKHEESLKAMFLGGTAIGAICVQLHGYNILLVMLSIIFIYYLFIFFLRKIDVDLDKSGV